MKGRKIVFYVSDHGQGHAARAAAILEWLLPRLADTVRVEVRTSAPLRFLQRYLAGFSGRIDYVYVENDVGLVLQERSLEVDIRQQELEVRDWLCRFDDYVLREVEALRGSPERVELILADITPQAFLVAQRLGVPGVGLSSFTWWGMYRYFWGEDGWLEKLREAYAAASAFFRMAFFSEEVFFPLAGELGYVARRLDPEKVARLRREFSRRGEITVCLGFGRGSVDDAVFSQLALRGGREIHFLLPAGVELHGANYSNIPPEETDSQNYLAACDLGVGKAGFSTVCEFLQGGVPMLLVRRPILEDEAIVREVEARGWGRGLEAAELFSPRLVGLIRREIVQRKRFAPPAVNQLTGLERYVREVLDL